LRGGDKALRDRFADLLRDLVSRGRAAGVIVVAATQKPSHEIVPTFIRDLFAYRLAFRSTSPEASDTILGQGWASQGYTASTIDPQQRGVGYLIAEGGIPRQILSANIRDEDLQCLIELATKARSS
jgi:S-DNA-T family DNA segregation ATPase FtsK/SpoIIIE